MEKKLSLEELKTVVGGATTADPKSIDKLSEKSGLSIELSLDLNPVKQTTTLEGERIDK